jgi:hypothetical protein
MLKKPVQVKQPISASFEDFVFMIESFHKAAGMTGDIAQIGGVKVA